MASKKTKTLLDLDDDDVKLEINKDYAQKYTTWREKEELQKLKTKYGEDVGDDSSSSEEEEDEDAEALTGAIDKNWFRALAAVRSNDPRIYQKDIKFFESDDEEQDSDSDASGEKKQKKKKKEEDQKPMYMKEFERKLITEKGGLLSESDDEDDEETEKKIQVPGYYEEQEAIKKSITSAIADVSSDDENEDVLIKRIKTKQEQADEEEEFIQFLKGEKEKEDLRRDKDIAQELAPLKEMYSGPGAAEDDKQLWNIVLDQGFRKKTKAKDMDWYAEQMAQLHAEEEAAEQQDEFEHKYNFRFEEPDKDFVKTYARNPEDSVRQKDNKRALKRQEVKERKKMEKENKQEEIRQLKNMKRKEILTKLDQLKEVTGNPDVAFSAKDIEEEFDPASHDKMMQQYFGDDFYEEEENEKPQFDDDDDDDVYGDDEDWDAWTGPSNSQREGSDEGHAGYSGPGTSYDAEADYDDSNFNMDADYDPEQPSYTSGKKKKKSKFRQVIEKKKPLFEEVCKKYEGSDHPFGDYLDEYFKLDCEDIIAGDVKCRFRYRKTVPNDYGLTVEEILRCPEKELNAWASLKKITQFRNEDDEMYEVRKYKRARVLRKKLNVLPSLKEPVDSSGEQEKEDLEQLTKKRKKRRRDEEDEEFSFEEMEVEQSSDKRQNVPSLISEHSPKKKKKKDKAGLTKDSSADQAETEHPSKEKKGSKNSADLELSDSSKKKSKKHRMEAEVSDSDASPVQKRLKHLSEAEGSDLSLAEEKVKKGSKKPTGLTNQPNGEVKQKKKKNKNKAAGGKGQLSHVMKKKGKKLKQSDGTPKKKGYQAGDMISDSRLVALGIDPRKFKYTKHRIMQEPGGQE